MTARMPGLRRGLTHRAVVRRFLAGDSMEWLGWWASSVAHTVPPGLAHDVAPPCSRPDAQKLEDRRRVEEIIRRGPRAEVRR